MRCFRRCCRALLCSGQCEILFVVKEQRPWRNMLSDPIGANFFTEPSVRKSAEIQIVAYCLWSTDFRISNEDF